MKLNSVAAASGCDEAKTINETSRASATAQQINLSTEPKTWPLLPKSVPSFTACRKSNAPMNNQTTAVGSHLCQLSPKSPFNERPSHAKPERLSCPVVGATVPSLNCN